MSPEEVAKLIAENPVLSVLSEAELQSLWGISDTVDHDKGETIFTQLDEPDYFFFVIEGAVQLLVNGNEYKIMEQGDVFGEIGVINKSIRVGQAITDRKTKLLRVDGKAFFDPERFPAEIALKVLRKLTTNITSYLKLREQASTEELIARGEGEYVEFKSTLRMNMATGQKDTRMEKASLKTIVAFLNSKGGILLIGVKDNGEINGLDADRFPNDDKLLLYLTDLIKTRIGSMQLAYIKLRIIPLGDKKVLRVECTSSSFPAYLNMDNEEHFYIRTGPATTSMRISRVFPYITQRFGNLKLE